MSDTRLRVFKDENGKNYVKKFTKEETDTWLQVHPDHTLVR